MYVFGTCCLILILVILALFSQNFLKRLCLYLITSVKARISGNFLVTLTVLETYEKKCCVFDSNILGMYLYYMCTCVLSVYVCRVLVHAKRG